MKIEKITENKIRVIIDIDDLEKDNTDLKAIFNKNLPTQDFFLNILKKAEKEVDFYTDGCKLLIEAFTSTDNVVVFTITKYASDKKNTFDNLKRRKIKTKRKSFNFQNNTAIYCFENFDIFCDFCCALNNFKNFSAKKISKDISLYLYNDTYYLVLKNIDIKYESLKLFYSTISEFSKSTHFSNNFSNKLLEHGKVIIKKNAINIAIKHFA